MGELRRLKEYLRWGQAQQKLTETPGASNKTYSFFDAASELWRSGAVQRGEELPTVSFLDWDLEDLDGFYRRIRTRSQLVWIYSTRPSSTVRRGPRRRAAAGVGYRAVQAGPGPGAGAASTRLL